MDLREAILTRRSISKFTEQVPSRDDVQMILESAVWAPNHYKTEPWRFQILIGDGREKLGQVYGAIEAETLNIESDEGRIAFEKGYKKAFRAPVIIAILAEMPEEDDRAVAIEDVMATACGVQNMMLTAHSLGLGSIWRTGAAVYHDFMQEAFAFSEHTKVLGFLYLGYPLTGKQPPVKRPMEEVAVWIAE